jgi:transglutaminase-like putative cysteine protease
VPFEATLPAGTLFLFTSLLGADTGQAGAAAMFGTALLGFLLLHRTARQEVASHWVSDHRALGRRSLLVAGGTLGILAVVAGTVIGPNLPGADSPGLLDPRDLDEKDSSRVTVSPLVDIRSRLVDQSALEVFTVQADSRAYWRLTSLERFNGTIWSSSGSYGEADEDLPESVETDVATTDISQTYTISALSAIWLPSAFEARSFRADDVDARYDEESSTLIVDNSVPTSDGLTYRVISASPRYDAAELSSDDARPREDILEDYLTLPDGFSPRVEQLAQEITSGQPTPYGRAVALQAYLRGFTYDLSVQSGHSGNVLEQFLFETQRGYCEQFAGSFAAMARAVGLPARVAVGFTPGEVDPNDPTLFRVRGEHAHAWPEVYFEGAGWVPFEPTPGRGIPNAEPYTGVPEQQAAAGQPDAAEVQPQTTPPPQPGPDGQTPDDASTDTTAAPDATEGPGGAAGRSNVERYVTGPAGRAVPWVLIAIVAYLVACPALLVLQRRIRRQRAEGPEAQIALAWTEAAEGAAVVGYSERPSDTYAERARRLADDVPGASTESLQLARLIEAAHYTPDGAENDAVPAAWEASGVVRRSAWSQAPWTRRARQWFDPRPTLRTWRTERTRHQRHITTLPTGDRDERRLVGVGAGPDDQQLDDVELD